MNNKYTKILSVLALLIVCVVLMGQKANQFYKSESMNTHFKNDLAIGGDLNVGNGTPSTTQNGEDVFVEGTFENDGGMDLDGAVDIDAAVDIDGGLTDIGTGTYARADGDNDLGVDGDLEVNGNAQFDGILDANSQVDIDATTITLDGGLTNIGGGSYATADGDNDLGVAGDFEVDGATDLDGALAVAGAATLASTLAVTGIHTLGPTSMPTATAVSLTSPTVTFSVAGKRFITLSSDANQTACVPTGGALNQILTIQSAASGSNTMQFDDGTSTVLGANITLTEAQYDYLTLICMHADGDVWAAISAHDN